MIKMLRKLGIENFLNLIEKKKQNTGTKPYS